MPLVIPTLTSPSTSSSNPTSENPSKKAEWMNKLMGKKLTEGGEGDELNFAKKDLPKEVQIIEEGATGGAQEEGAESKLTIELAADGTVMNVR